MRAVFALVLLVGMGLAGMAVYMIQGYMADLEGALQREQAFNAKAGKLVEVYVFAKPKKYGDALAEDDVQLIYWPEKALPGQGNPLPGKRRRTALYHALDRSVRASARQPRDRTG
jgi:Flp pilus assembly protein CpaB